MTTAPVRQLDEPSGPAISTAMPVVFDARVVTGTGGGPDKTILNSPRFLTPHGYRMLCGYLYPPDDPGFAEIERKAARYSAPLIAIPDRSPWDWRIVSQLLDVLRRERVAIWHGHDYKTNALGLLLKRFHRMRLVTTVHGWGVQQSMRTALYYRLDRACLPRYERVFCVSEDLYAICRRCGVSAKRLVLLENAIDLGEYTRSRSVESAKRALGFDPARWLIGAVGRLSPEKGFDILLRSVKELIVRGRNVEVVLVGEGDDRPRLEALTRELGLTDRVRLTGWQSDVRGYYESMDLFALSSFREGLPNALLEAMALEVPAVATRIAGVPRLIRDGETGWLVEPHDVAGLTHALDTMLTTPAIRDRSRLAARRWLEERYSFPARMRTMAAVYDDLLSGVAL